MIQANGEQFCLAAVSYATSASRRLFEGRDNPERVHLSEAELTTLLARAVEVTLDTIQLAVSKMPQSEAGRD